MAQRFVNPYPKYLQVREILRGRIERSATVGKQLATEHALCEEFGVSRETVRDALHGLEQEGLISRRRGRGTFVTRVPQPRGERRLTGLSEDFSALKLDTDVRVLEQGLALPPPSVAELMGLEPDEMVYRIARLRFFSNDHFAHHDAFLPVEIGVRIVRLDLSRTSMMHELRQTLGLAMWEDHQRIEATVAEPELATILRIPVGVPLLCITRHFLTEKDRTAVVFRSHYRADRYYYTVKIAQGERQPEMQRRPRSKPRKATHPRNGRTNAGSNMPTTMSDEPGRP